MANDRQRVIFYTNLLVFTVFVFYNKLFKVKAVSVTSGCHMNTQIGGFNIQREIVY